MKTIKSVFTVVVILAFGACQQPQPQTECPPVPLTDLFLTSMQLKPDKGAVYTEGSYKAIQETFYNALIKKGLSDSIKFIDPLSSPLDDEQLVLTKAEIERKLIRVDTVYIENPNPPHELSMQVTRDTMSADLLASIRAYEKWYLTDSLKLNREVTGYLPVCEVIDAATGEVRGWMPLFNVSPETKGERKKVATIQYQQPVKSDLRNWYHNNLEISARHKLFNPIIKAAWNGAIPVYDNPEGTALTTEKLRENLCFVDTMYIENPMPPYDLQMTVVEECQSEFYDQVDAIALVQDVYVDDNLALSFEVKWYAPVMNVYNRMTGKPTGETRTMFWVKN